MRAQHQEVEFPDLRRSVVVFLRRLPAPEPGHFEAWRLALSTFIVTLMLAGVAAAFVSFWLAFQLYRIPAAEMVRRQRLYTWFWVLTIFVLLIFLVVFLL